MSDKNILLVEGDSDRQLLESLCETWRIPVRQVKVCTPRDAGHRKNSKQAVWAVLPLHLAQLADGTLERLALVVDADSPPNGGVDTTLSQLKPLLSAHGYQWVADETTRGLRFTHADGLPDVGVWIMPNNASPGMAEDWLKACVHPNESDLMRHVQQAIATLPGGPKFKPLHQSKAEIATWLAWQAKPGHGLYYAVQTEGLLDDKAELAVALQDWLVRIFAGKPSQTTTTQGCVP